jgi:2-polyprenyl-3-methyl-5-hydroxy-6-metoxy-1,4-benzoquinol methylase
MFKKLKSQVQGFAYLFSHPAQLKRIIIREARYGKRRQSKRSWMDWQKYDQYTAHLLHSSAEARARPLNVERIKTISDMVSHSGNGLKVLDVGCGEGSISQQIANMGNYVTSVDLPTITNLAHRHRALSVVAGDAEQLAFVPNSFDLVLASEVIEHLWNPLSFFDEARRVLADNGHLIIEVPEGKESLRWDAHKNYFTVEGLKQMLAAKFTACEVKLLQPTGFPTPTMIMRLRKSRKTKKSVIE